ncbi:hypothetical protein LCGC14_3022270, partial [marine sediment metagenome]
MADRKEHKEVITSGNVYLKSGCDGIFQALCCQHMVAVNNRCQYPGLAPGTQPTFTLTEESLDLPEFARRVSRFFRGPKGQILEFTRDLSTLELVRLEHSCVD